MKLRVTYGADDIATISGWGCLISVLAASIILWAFAIGTVLYVWKGIFG